MAHSETVPVKFSGLTVGSAEIREDGTIDIHIDGGSEWAKRLLYHIEQASVTGLSLGPIFPPDPNYSESVFREANNPSLPRSTKSNKSSGGDSFQHQNTL